MGFFIKGWYVEVKMGDQWYRYGPYKRNIDAVADALKKSLKGKRQARVVRR